MSVQPFLFIVALRSEEYPRMPEFARHSLECSRRHSGCRVVGLSDYDEAGWEDVRPVSDGLKLAIRSIKSNNNGVVPREAYPIFRWLLIGEYIERFQVRAPVISIDWDALVFGNLWSHFQNCGLESYDYGSCFDHERSGTYAAPAVVLDLRAVHVFTSLIQGVLKSWAPALLNERGGFAGGGDMVWWNRVGEACRYKVATVSKEVSGALFDGNIILDADTYEHDGCQGKRIVMRDGKPHFVRKDGQLVRAVAVHCFMAWKNRTGELVPKSR